MHLKTAIELLNALQMLLREARANSYELTNEAEDTIAEARAAAAIEQANKELNA